jgi:hypothetical protein
MTHTALALLLWSPARRARLVCGAIPLTAPPALPITPTFMATPQADFVDSLCKTCFRALGAATPNDSPQVRRGAASSLSPSYHFRFPRAF